MTGGPPETEDASDADDEAAQWTWDACEALSPEEHVLSGGPARPGSLLTLYSEQTTPLQEESETTLYLEDGGVFVYRREGALHYMQGADDMECSGYHVITQNDPTIPSEEGILISPDTDRPISITLRDIDIDTEEAAIRIEGSGTVILTLEGTNRIASGTGPACVVTGSDGEVELIIRGGGSLEATGSGAGLDSGEDAAIRVESGTISACGGEGAAGIGGAGEVAISGGDVTASGGEGAPSIASASRITLSGGTVRTFRETGGAEAGVYEIGGYPDAFSTGAAPLTSGENGRAVLYVSGPDRIGGWDSVKESWNGIVWEGDAGTVYGTVDLSEAGLTVEAGQTLEIPGDPASGPVLTLSTDSFRNDGTIAGTGLVMLDGKEYRAEDGRLVPLDPDPPADISGSLSLSISGWTYGQPADRPTLSCTDPAVRLEEAGIRYTYSGTRNDGTAVMDAAEAPTQAGSYTVTAFYGDGEHAGSASAAFVISRAACGGEPACEAVTESGRTLADARLSMGTLTPAGGALRWKLDGGTPVERGAAYEWVYLPADADNYAALSGELIVWKDDGSEKPSEVPEPPSREEPPADRPSGGSAPSPEPSGRTPDAAPAAPDQAAGDRTTETTGPDGTKVIEVTREDGSSSTTTVSASGRTETTVELSESAAAQSAEIRLPMPAVPSTQDAARAPSVTVNGPEGAVVRVEVPVQNAVPGTVAVVIHPDGTREVLRQTAPSEGGIVITVAAGVTVQILDNSRDFADVSPEHWAGNAVDFVTSRELFSGTSKDAFSPDQGMTRGMLMTVLARLDGVDTSGGGIWYEKGMAWAVARGVSSGEDPDQAVTCEQAVTMLYRYAGKPAPAGGQTSLESLKGFPTDAYSVSDYAVAAMDWAARGGLLEDADGGYMVPKSGATRAQAAVLLMRFVERCL